MSPFVSLIVLILFIPIALSDEYPRLLNCLKQEEAEINKCERSKTCIIIVDRRHATIDVSIDWVMKDFKTGAIVTIPYEYNHNERFVLKPYTAKPAMYVIQAIMTLNGNIVPDMNRCYFFVPARNPIAVITGGETRSVCGWQQFVVSGQESMDVDTRVNEEVHLSYKWSCNQKLATNNFCKKDPVSSDATVTVPATHAMPDEIFSFTLEVTTESGLSAVTAQEVYVGETDMTVITIRCQRNCPPVSETSLGNSPTLLYATCDANCKGIKDEDYIWKVNATDFNCEQHTEFGCDHPKLLVKKDVLKPGVYGFAVSLKDGRPVKAGAVVIVAAPPEGVTCEINPNSGDALQTWHKLKCKYPAEDSHTFELFVQDVTGRSSITEETSFQTERIEETSPCISLSL